MRKVFSFVCFAIIVCMMLCSCSDPGPTFYPMGYLWESDAGNVTVSGYTLTESYTLADGSLIEAEEGNILLAIELETQFNEGWSVFGHCEFGENGHYEPDYYPICEPVVWDEGKTVLLYSMPETEAIGADYRWYFLDLMLLGRGTVEQTFFLADSMN